MKLYLFVIKFYVSRKMSSRTPGGTLTPGWILLHYTTEYTVCNLVCVELPALEGNQFETKKQIINSNTNSLREQKQKQTIFIAGIAQSV
jgi:hypothetical protein